MGFFSGTKGKYKQLSLLSPEQQPLSSQLINASQGAGAGGAFGDVADYYRGNLGNNPQDFQAFAAPEMRQFNEQTIPGLAEQFAGMGSGGLSSSGFRNAAIQAGTGLSERLGAIRAQLRQQAAQGLMGVGQQALQPTVENIYQPGTPGIGGSLGGLFGTAAGSLLGPAGSAIGGFLGNQLFGGGGQQGQPQAQPQSQNPQSLYQSSWRQNAPNFGGF